MRKHVPSWAPSSLALAAAFALLPSSPVSAPGPAGIAPALALPCPSPSTASELAPCFGVVTLEATVWHLSCLNWSCAQTCSVRDLPFINPLSGQPAVGSACTCGGVPSPCCKLFFIDQGGGDAQVYAVGDCSSTDSSCPAGDLCSPLGSYTEGGFEITPECVPESQG